MTMNLVPQPSESLQPFSHINLKAITNGLFETIIFTNLANLAFIAKILYSRKNFKILLGIQFFTPNFALAS